MYAVFVFLTCCLCLTSRVSYKGKIVWNCLGVITIVCLYLLFSHHPNYGYHNQGLIYKDKYDVNTLESEIITFIPVLHLLSCLPYNLHVFATEYSRQIRLNWPTHLSSPFTLALHAVLLKYVVLRIPSHLKYASK